MNSVELIGRLTRDPEVRFTSKQTAVANFTLAIDRPTKGEADFPRVIVFGSQAENCEKYLKKGRLVAVQGRIQTGSYQNKQGDTIYTTDVVANRVEFLEWTESKKEPKQESFEQVEEDIPFSRRTKMICINGVEYYGDDEQREGMRLAREALGEPKRLGDALGVIILPGEKTEDDDD